MVVTSTERMSEAEYRQFALGDTAGQWELVRGRLREKPGMSVEHRVAIMRVLGQLLAQAATWRCGASIRTNAR